MTVAEATTAQDAIDNAALTAVPVTTFTKLREREHAITISIPGCSAAALALCAAAPARAEMSAEELAKLAQNPVGNLISVPFQNNTNLNFGPEKGTQNILNIQPVIPVSVDKDWNIITRTIVPVIWNPALGPDIDSKSGVGDTVFTAFLSPANPGQWIWGAGPVVQIPTNSNAELGNKNWGRDRRWSYCISTMAIRGCTARWSTTSGRLPATSRAAPTTMDSSSRSSITTSKAACTSPARRS